MGNTPLLDDRVLSGASCIVDYLLSVIVAIYSVLSYALVYDGIEQVDHRYVYVCGIAFNKRFHAQSLMQ